MLINLNGAHKLKWLLHILHNTCYVPEMCVRVVTHDFVIQNLLFTPVINGELDSSNNSSPLRCGTNSLDGRKKKEKPLKIHYDLKFTY